MMHWTSCFQCMSCDVVYLIKFYLKNWKFISCNSGVSANILNDKKQSPIHLATELNKVKALKVMGNYRNLIDIQKGGEHGRTALHLAAIYDHEECARILVRWV